MKMFINNNKLNITLVSLFLVINSLFYIYREPINTNYFYLKELIYFIDFILVARFSNQGISYAKNKLKNLKTKTDLSSILLIVIRKIQFPINIAIFFTFISLFLKPLLIERHNFDDAIVIYDYFIEYGAIFLIFFTVYQVVSSFRKDKTSVLEMKAKRAEDEESLFEIKYELTILHGLFRFVNFLLLAILIGLFTRKAGISLASILAFGSIIIVVVGMGSRYFLANIFGGLMILFYRPFNIGDYIKIPEKNIEGTVYNIGWLTVRIKNSHKNTTHIPNSMFSLCHVDNQSDKFGNKIEEHFRFELTHLKAVKKKVKAIRTLLTEHSGIDTEESIIVNINSINGDYFNLKFICTTHPTNTTQYSSIKQDLLIKIYDMFQDAGIDLYKEKNILEIIKQQETEGA